MSTNPQEQHQPISAADRDKVSPVWDMSQERVFIENLLARRFNFFLVFFSIVLAGSMNVKTQAQLQIVLGIGSIICVLFAMVLARSQEKLDLILQDLFSDESHPATIIDRRDSKGGSRRRYLGVWQFNNGNISDTRLNNGGRANCRPALRSTVVDNLVITFTSHRRCRAAVAHLCRYIM